MATGNQTAAEGSAGTFASDDGTSIAYWRSGEGPPLLLIHGTAADHGRWSMVLPAFEERFTVFAIDRRGRGGSGDGDGQYTIEREVADVAAVVDGIGEPVHVLGHSYGALCALEAMPLTPNMRKLVLYEPPLTIADEVFYPPDVVDRLDALLAAGDREGVVYTTMREVAGAPAAVVEQMRARPAWPARVAAAHTIPRELRAQQSYRFTPERFRETGAPILFLLGSNSPTEYTAAARALTEALPDARIVVLPGQGHVAMDTATDLFTSEVLRFLTAG